METVKCNVTPSQARALKLASHWSVVSSASTERVRRSSIDALLKAGLVERMAHDEFRAWRASRVSSNRRRGGLQAGADVFVATPAAMTGESSAWHRAREKAEELQRLRDDVELFKEKLAELATFINKRAPRDVIDEMPEELVSFLGTEVDIWVDAVELVPFSEEERLAFVKRVEDELGDETMFQEVSLPLGIGCLTGSPGDFIRGVFSDLRRQVDVMVDGPAAFVDRLVDDLEELRCAGTVLRVLQCREDEVARRHLPLTEYAAVVAEEIDALRIRKAKAAS